jgi:hypothetical protein
MKFSSDKTTWFGKAAPRACTEIHYRKFELLSAPTPPPTLDLLLLSADQELAPNQLPKKNAHDEDWVSHSCKQSERSKLSP